MATEHARVSGWQGETLPSMVDRLARDNPNGVYGLWPTAPTSYDLGFRTITYAQLANIVNGLAWLIVKELWPGTEDHPVLTYVGPNDVRLTAMILAAVKTNYVLFLTSPRNSPAAHRSLFEALKCETLVTTDPTPPPANAILEAANPRPRQLTVPGIDELLAQTYPPFSYDKPFEAARWDPLVVIHTSGSTGIPKPLIWTQECGIRHHDCAARNLPDQEGVTSVDHFITGKRLMVTVPPFHGAGMGQYMLWAIPFGSIPIAPAAVGIVTAQGLADALTQTPADVAVLVPSVVAELAQNPALLDYCAARLELILYIGGDLPQAIGDIVAAKIPLRCWWGASEVSIPHQLVAPGLGPNDWRYIRFHPSVGAVFEKVTEDTYELVIRRGKEPLPQVCFSIRGQQELDEYRTKDLFSPHPTVPDAWCWRARADDIIVFLNGEKTNPVSMEQHVVARNPELGGALVLGTRRFQAALLIEPVVKGDAGDGALTTAEQAALIERIWPSVQEANSTAPAHARVEKALILVTTPDRPLIRAGKGTIQRAASVAQYTAEIEALYTNAELGPDGDGEPHAPLVSSDPESVSRFVQESVSAVTSWPHEDGDHQPSATFFERGMDSLMALQLTRVLRRGLHRPDIGLPTVYRNPTVSQLTSAILESTEDGSKDDDRALMESLLSTYRGLIDQIPKPQTSPNPDSTTENEPLTTILTGSTGTIGTHLLHTLLNRPGIGSIICLNRSPDGGKASQESRFSAAGLDPTALSTSRVMFLHANPSQPLLGLDAATYEDLRARAGLVIHNAWPVNFNLGLAAFRPHLAGLVNLLTLSVALERPFRGGLVFVSSVSAAGGVGAAPEEILRSLDVPHRSGYARSKFLGELLCDAAAERLGVPVTVARVGQVAGAVQRSGGEWNRAEWLPSLVISSLLRLGGSLPGDLGPQFSEVDWLPVDILSDILVDIATRPGHVPGGGGADVFNLRNPQTTSWEALLPAIIDATKTYLPSKIEPEVVPASTWLACLRESETGSQGTKEDDSSNPAIKLLDFYADGLWGSTAQDVGQNKTQPMAIERALASSSTLRGVPAVSAEWMQKWAGEWLQVGK
ncbi:hypothetical protein N8I77_009668 [Diaporthe amygdali]|uniref:Carrier domain-containing protein n=1 Tax=Phomopsis amygdali TaxID=1214568 RepID=A0AAD9SAM9_PHOAM|nr:hypothetical protein N8I77_009668 [Diaporthe amygdali]